MKNISLTWKSPGILHLLDLENHLFNPVTSGTFHGSGNVTEKPKKGRYSRLF